ncbi:helix-turn-helix domain-containing protein [Gracilibacillus alcaliphilus]|uniref:helix-turn-helix domain-containing protein n=1 Tax=Gracilibacillus alcaliphilus TaxID=1401441 RepID=UPI001956FCA0|nr:helix-turn-helix transcriptional regulator [Gracilibacillus alcaliphilus]MBM7678158.1 transcriptional regulator with XRE-family HTH domain [Gracilibacillus alcaliphilus]
MSTNRRGKRIKAFRKLKGYTQISFAEAIGMSVTYLGEIERGRKEPTTEQLKKITEQLGITLEELDPDA